MDRRDSLQTTAGTLAALGALSPLLPAAPAPRPDLAVARGPLPERTVRAALDALGGIRRFIAKGDVVVVKPNMGWDRRPEYAATTNPAVVAALVKLRLEAGAAKVKVFDRPVNDPRRTYVQSGIEAAARAAGAEVSYMDEHRFREVKIPQGTAIQPWLIYIDVLEADKLINVPIAKHHGLGRLNIRRLEA